jgi:NodT family efflux transporter outer membrane factor (OMF) lipoprotein
MSKQILLKQSHMEKLSKRPIKSLVLKMIAGVLAAFLLAGCAAVGPDYIPPKISAPEQWRAELKQGLSQGSMDSKMMASWWITLNDPMLTDLIQRAVKGNLDLKEARSRVREARARRGISAAEHFPTLDLSGSAASSYSGKDIGSGERRESYSTGFDAYWELDVFGGVRRSVEAAQANLETNQENYRDVMVSLLAEVALNYVEVRTSQKRLDVAEKNLETQAQTYELTVFRFKAGLASALDMEQAKYNLENTRSQIPTLRINLEEAMNRMALLLGIHPGTLHADLSERKPIPVTSLEIAVGVPAEVLRRRPDIRRAERELAAQTARVGVATADLYPKFSLRGSIGLEALSFGDLFSSGNRSDSIGSSFSWNIFDAGAIRKNIEVQNALQEQALIQYEAAILTALEDVENALVAYAQDQIRRQSLIQATQASKRAVDLALKQYSSGIIDFQDVLEAQRSLLSFQTRLAETDGAVTSNLISLYKALGGGWTSLMSETAGSNGKN